MFIAPGLFVDENAIEVRFIRASGPGGQNVNKVSSAVELRFDLARSGLDGAMLGRVAELAGRRLNQAGILILRADRFRTQEQNRADARARLAALLHAAAVPPRTRRPTRKPLSADRVRRADKQHRAGVKTSRRAVDLTE